MVAGPELRGPPADQTPMGLDSIAAVQARIREIQQQFSGPTRTTMPVGQSTSTAATAGATQPDFASLLAGASGSASPATTPTSSSATAQQFLATALAEKGKPY